MSALASAALLAAAEGAGTGVDLPFPSWVFGLGTFVFLVACLLGVLTFGKGRRHG